MKILLININPVVSRLLTLCTRDEHIELIEVDNAKKCEKTSYDIVFVDESSYVDDVKELLEKLKARKKKPTKRSLIIVSCENHNEEIKDTTRNT